jgi:thiol-disulfide isomerase/thioredoxin
MDRSTPPVSKRNSTPQLMIILLLVAAIGAILFWRNRQSSAEDDLHGDSEHASLALGDTLRKTPEADRLPLLLKHANDPSPGLRYAAIDALGNDPSPRAIAAIEHAFTDSSSVVRQRALEVLPRLDRDRGLRLLLSGLRDEDNWIREAAVSQMKFFVGRQPKIVGRRAVPMLIQSLSDDSPSVPGIATSLLSKLTSNPWIIKFNSPKPDQKRIIGQWERWWKRDQGNWTTAEEYSNPPLILPTRTDPLPDVRITDIDHQAVSVPGSNGHIAMLNFWGTWCPPCQIETRDLKRLHTEYGKDRLDIIGIAVGEKNGEKGLRDWCKTKGLSYRQALATDAVQRAFGDIEEVPVSILIDRKGQIRYRWEGERDYATFHAAIERLLHEH